MNEIIRPLHGEVLGPDKTVRVIGRTRTFKQAITDVTLPAGHSIAELLETAIGGTRSRFPMAYAVSVDGMPVPADLFARVRPKAGRTVSFEPRLASGSTGRSILLIAAAVAAIVVAVAFPILVPTLLGSAILSTVVGGLLAGGIAIGAQMAANALFPITKPVEAIADAREGAESVYAIQGAQNQADPFGPIPSILGRVRVFPRLAAQPYTSFSGEDQYLRMLFCVGYGPLDMDEFKIGETDIFDFEGISIETREGYDDDSNVTLYSKQAFEDPLSVELTNAASWQQRTTPADITTISVDITAPSGIYKVDKKTGDVNDYRIRVVVEASPVGENDWFSLGEIDKTISKQEPKRWGVEAQVSEGQYDVRVRKASGDNDNNKLQVTEALFWTTLRTFRSDQAIQYDKRPLALVALKIKASGQLNNIIDSFNLVAQSRVTTAGDFVQAAAASGALASTNNWSGWTARQVIPSADISNETAGDFARVTFLAAVDEPVRIAKAYIQLGATSGDVYDFASTPVQLTFNGETSVFIPQGQTVVCDPVEIDIPNGRNVIVSSYFSDAAADKIGHRVQSGWHIYYKQVDEAATVNVSSYSNSGNSNMSWVTKLEIGGGFVDQESSNPADLFRHVLQGPAIYEAVPDEQVDIPGLATWRDYCTAQGWEYNREHNFRGSVFDTLTAICTAGRARLVRTDGLWGVIHDEADPPVAQHFTPRNSWGFEENRIYVDPPHAFRVNFVNAAKGWVPDEVVVYDDDYDEDNATRFEAIEFPGVTDQDLNWRHGRFQIAQLRLRPSTYSLMTNWQAIACTVGSRVWVAHDVTFWGLYQGRVKAVASGDVITLDQEITFETGKEYQIRFRQADGTSVLRPVVHPGTAGNFFSFALIAGAPDPEVGDLVMFGEDDPGPAMLLRVREIEWMPDLRARISLVDDAPEISDADTGDIPAYDSGVTSPASLFLRKPSNPQISESLRSVEGITYTDVQFSWQQLESDLVKGFEAQMRNDAAAVADWERMALTPPTQTYVVEYAITPGTYSFRVRTQFSNGSWSDWTALNGVTVAAAFFPPDDVENFRISILNDTATLSWDRVSRDVSYYVIKHTPDTLTPSWGSAITLRAQVTDTSVLVPALTGTYLIKAVRSSGTESVNATMIIATGANLIALNSVEVVDPAPTWGGTKNGVKVDGANLVLNNRPLDGDTKAMLRFEGIDLSTDISDDTGAHTWTAQGAAAISTLQAAMGASSLLCGGSGDYVDTPDHADFSLGSAAFTIGVKFKPGGGNGTRRIMAGQLNSGETAAGSAWSFELTTGNVVKAQLSNGTTFTSVTGTTTFLAAGLAFHEVELIRTGNTLRMFIDGTQEGGDVSFTGTVPNSSAALAVGRGGEKVANTWFGNLDDFAMSTGIARHTASFTPAPAREEYEDLLTDDELNALVAVGRYDFITGAGSPTEQIDLGEEFTSRVTATLLAFGDNLNNVMSSWLTLDSVETLSGADSEDWRIIFEERHTSDDPGGSPVDWSEWREIQISDITARSYQFRVWLFTYNPAIRTTVEMAAANVDMPDRSEPLGDLAVGTGGLVVTFAQAFRHLETVVVTAIQSAVAGDHAVISARSETGFTVHVKDATEANVARTVDAIAAGYGRVVS